MNSRFHSKTSLFIALLLSFKTFGIGVNLESLKDRAKLIGEIPSASLHKYFGKVSIGLSENRIKNNGDDKIVIECSGQSSTSCTSYIFTNKNRKNVTKIEGLLKQKFESSDEAIDGINEKMLNKLGKFFIGAWQARGNPYVFKSKDRDLLIFYEDYGCCGGNEVHISIVNTNLDMLCKFSWTGEDSSEPQNVNAYRKNFLKDPESFFRWKSEKECSFNL